MSKKSFEKPQNGNPHQLTINQHFFPRRSIERFAGVDKMVCVYSKAKKKYLRLHPNNEIFLTRRTWNQRAESEWMRDIEDRFQALADAVIEGSVQDISIEDARTISDFWILWHLRAQYKDNPLPDTRLNGIAADPTINKDRQEYLEKNFIGCIRDDGTISGRDMTGDRMQIHLLSLRKLLSNLEWKIVKASEGEFIVPDVFAKDTKSVYIVPLTPIICFAIYDRNISAGMEEVRQINKLAIECSRNFYFAQDFSKCPV